MPPFGGGPFEQISQLVAEYAQISQAADIIAAGDARIAGFSIVSNASGGMASVSAQGMEYPPQMMQTIEQIVTTRRNELRQRLSELGVSLPEAQARRK